MSVYNVAYATCLLLFVRPYLEIQPAATIRQGIEAKAADLTRSIRNPSSTGASECRQAPMQLLILLRTLYFVNLRGRTWSGFATLGFVRQLFFRQDSGHPPAWHAPRDPI